MGFRSRRVVWWLALFPSIAVAGPGGGITSPNQETWRAEVTIKHTHDSKSSDGSKSHLEESASLSATELANLHPAGGLQINHHNPTIESLSGTHSLESSSSGKDHSTTKETLGKLDRTQAGWGFSLGLDGSWTFGADVPGTASQTTTWTCSPDEAKMGCTGHSEAQVDILITGATGSDQGGKLTKSSKGYTIDGTHDETTDSGDRDHVEIHATLTKVGGEIKYDAVLIPADVSGYRRWIPKGPELPKGTDEKGGNTLGVKLEIRDHKSGKPANVAFSAVYTLDASAFPGWSMNTPKQADANDKPDLFFSKTQNSGRDVPSERELRTLHAVGKDSLLVTSRDFGGHATLSATVTFEDGAESVQTKYEYTDTAGKKTLRDAPFPIPMDENHNDVADGWEDAMHVLGDNRKSDDDLEDIPAKMATKGDGYTLFEEYRGFWIEDPRESPNTTKRVLQRLDPREKDLLIAAYGPKRERGLYLSGARMFGAATGIHIYAAPDKDAAVAFPSDPPTWVLLKDDGSVNKTVTLTDYPRWVAFNAAKDDQKHFGGKQVAMRIWELDVDMGLSAWMDGIGDRTVGKKYEVRYGMPSQIHGAGMGMPHARGQISFWADAMLDGRYPTLAAAIKAAHLDPIKVSKYALAHKEELTRALVVFSTMHEMGHNLGGAEHGVYAYSSAMDIVNKGPASDRQKGEDEARAKYMTIGDEKCPQRYWQFDVNYVVRFLQEQWSPLTEKWHYDDYNMSQMRLRQRPGQDWEEHPTKRD